MEDDAKAERVAELRLSFQRLIDFHEASSKDIEAKAKYWLTAALPSFVALIGYLFKSLEAMPLPLLVAGCALAANLFVSTFLLSYTLTAQWIESGILIPTSIKVDDALYSVKSENRWSELQKDQLAELLRSIRHNQEGNAVKSHRLRLGEASLLRGAPASICVGAGCAFGYAAACPSGFSFSVPTVAGAIAGIGVGLVVTAVFVGVAHSAKTSMPNNKAA
jgi:hypothetical protein